MKQPKTFENFSVEMLIGDKKEPGGLEEKL